ncbi:MAG: GtrA family protein [Hungatella sp.]|jgi:putative flippase GtrA|nr:GtrA family protein [Hungatella sp.]
MKMLSKRNIMQFCSYFVVGGIAAIVEWIMFYIFASICTIYYMIATVLAFLFSTTANWLLGRMLTFKNDQRYIHNRWKEILAVFVVSGIGLIFNIIIMYILVALIGWDTRRLMTLSKIIATGIVFIWNFLIRKLVIYKN